MERCQTCGEIRTKQTAGKNIKNYGRALRLAGLPMSNEAVYFSFRMTELIRSNGDELTLKDIAALEVETQTKFNGLPDGWKHTEVSQSK